MTASKERRAQGHIERHHSAVLKKDVNHLATPGSPNTKILDLAPVEMFRSEVVSDYQSRLVCDHGESESEVDNRFAQAKHDQYEADIRRRMPPDERVHQGTTPNEPEARDIDTRKCGLPDLDPLPQKTTVPVTRRLVSLTGGCYLLPPKIAIIIAQRDGYSEAFRPWQLRHNARMPHQGGLGSAVRAIRDALIDGDVHRPDRGLVILRGEIASI
ncbi:MAG: hypothetical protein QOG97_1042 [Acidimicrobiaceae bacterium]|nr:hypothetical protein [Acidimicrobiaceae bacterium]MDQ1440814.1 hypothetical protein [Acidimicrobiaceae bacterium]